jgi:hypothetical protein
MAKYECVWCGEEIRRDPKDGWVHQSGSMYKGICFCEGGIHSNLTDNNGEVICPTWKNDHAAMPHWTGKYQMIIEAVKGEEDVRT